MSREFFGVPREYESRPYIWSALATFAACFINLRFIANFDIVLRYF